MLDSINDRCWAMLDWLWDRNIPIGAVFEKYGLPPILFPLMIILVVLLALWALSPTAPSADCGNFLCDEPIENCTSCPEDCGVCDIPITPPRDGLIVGVDITGSITDNINVMLYDNDDNVLASESGRKNLFEFTGISPQVIRASVICPNGKSQTSRPRTVSEANSVITMIPPDDCFQTVSNINTGEPVQTHGSVVVSVYDAVDREPIDATVTAIRVSDGLSEESSSTSNGRASLNLRSNNMYYLTASASGYLSFNGQNERFYMIAGDTVSKNIILEPMPEPVAPYGTLTVCAQSDSGSLRSGTITIVEQGGTELASAQLTPADGGCISFEIDSGKSATARAGALPAGCVASAPQGPITIQPDSQQSLLLDVDCGGDVAYVKVIIHNREGDLLTSDSIVTLWNAEEGEQLTGSAEDGSLSLGGAGYTEEITVPANVQIQAKAAGVPQGYVDTVSAPHAFTPGEHGTIDILLAEISRGQFNFNGASIIYTPATPGRPVHVFVEDIVFNETTLTDTNSDVSIIIEDREYSARYIG